MLYMFAVEFDFAAAIVVGVVVAVVLSTSSSLLEHSGLDSCGKRKSSLQSNIKISLATQALHGISTPLKGCGCLRNMACLS